KQRGRLVKYGEWRSGNQFTILDLAQVPARQRNSVRVVTPQRRFDEAGGDRLAIGLWCAGRNKQPGDEVFQDRSCETWHRESSETETANDSTDCWRLVLTSVWIGASDTRTASGNGTNRIRSTRTGNNGIRYFSQCRYDQGITAR